MKIYFYIITWIVLLCGCQDKPSNDVIKLNEEELLENLKAISHDSLEGRFFGTEGNYKTQRFIAQQFSAIGIEPAFSFGSIQEYSYTLKGKFRQWIYPISNPAKDHSNVPDTTVMGGNVVTIIRGEIDKAIVITAHLDHLGVQEGEIFNGADDNASGVAALLSMAKYFKDTSLQHTLIFAAVDAEEIGSLGCEHLLQNFPMDVDNIVLNINIDMISHNDSLQLYASGLHHYPFLKQTLENIKTSKIMLLYGHDDPNNKDIQDWTLSSDHRVFHRRNIPYVLFGVEDHKDYHKSTDTFENINQEFYIEAVKLIIQAIKGYDQFLSDEPQA